MAGSKYGAAILAAGIIAGTAYLLRSGQRTAYTAVMAEIVQEFERQPIQYLNFKHPKTNATVNVDISGISVDEPFGRVSYYGKIEGGILRTPGYNLRKVEINGSGGKVTIDEDYITQKFTKAQEKTPQEVWERLQMEYLRLSEEALRQSRLLSKSRPIEESALAERVKREFLKLGR